jgi:hypothetical protein
MPPINLEKDGILSITLPVHLGLLRMNSFEGYWLVFSCPYQDACSLSSTLTILHQAKSLVSWIAASFGVK